MQVIHAYVLSPSRPSIRTPHVVLPLSACPSSSATIRASSATTSGVRGNGTEGAPPQAVSAAARTRSVHAWATLLNLARTGRGIGAVHPRIRPADRSAGGTRRQPSLVSWSKTTVTIGSAAATTPSSASERPLGLRATTAAAHKTPPRHAKAKLTGRTSVVSASQLSAPLAKPATSTDAAREKRRGASGRVTGPSCWSPAVPCAAAGHSSAPQELSQEGGGLTARQLGVGRATS